MRIFIVMMKIRRIWLEVFAQVCSRYNWRCHAWCQMDNHYHILVETAEGNLSLGMRQLNGVYTQKSNRRHGLFGHVFQGRYKAILVQKDAYLLELSRYVVLNPVRAGMVSDVHEWQWSSYNVMIGNKHRQSGLKSTGCWLVLENDEAGALPSTRILSERVLDCRRSGRI